MGASPGSPAELSSTRLQHEHRYARHRRMIEVDQADEAKPTGLVEEDRYHAAADLAQLRIVEDLKSAHLLDVIFRGGKGNLSVSHGEKGRFHCDTPRFGLR